MIVSVGNLVVRKSYGGDIYFKVVDIQDGIALLKGVFQRLMADAPVEDLIPVACVKGLPLLKKTNYSRTE